MSKDFERLVGQEWLRDYLSGLRDDKGGQTSLGFNRVYPPIAQATSLAEAVFIDHMLYLWLTRKGEDEKAPYMMKRRKNYGIYIYPAQFCKETGISIRQFRTITKKYENLNILKTRIDASLGNRKYYKLRMGPLRKYLHECLCRVWCDVVVFPK